jgi:heme/copper-type cytochrome/quinol oxidase subunit 1
MPNHDGLPQHPEVRHEPSDASLGGVIMVIVWAMFLGAVILVLVWQFFVQYRAHEDQLRASPFPLALKPSESLPPEPRLEQLNRLANDPISNVYLRQQAREKKLNSYGHTEDKGYVHVPIERAMQAVVGELKARKDTSEPRENGLYDAGESNSGRLFRKEPRWSER